MWSVASAIAALAATSCLIGWEYRYRIDIISILAILTNTSTISLRHRYLKYRLQACSQLSENDLLAFIQRTKQHHLHTLHRLLSSRSSNNSNRSRSRLLTLDEISTLSDTAILREIQIQLAIIPPAIKHNNPKCND